MVSLPAKVSSDRSRKEIKSVVAANTDAKSCETAVTKQVSATSQLLVLSTSSAEKNAASPSFRYPFRLHEQLDLSKATQATTAVLHQMLSRTLQPKSFNRTQCSKLLLALVQVCRFPEADQILEALVPEFGSANKVEELEENTLHPHSHWFWICWTATLLNKEDLADFSYHRLRRFQHPITGSGLVSTCYHSCKVTEWQADIFSTAMLAKASLLRNQEDNAVTAAESLLRAIYANRSNVSKRQRFNLRWSFSSGFEEATGPELCILQNVSGQSYNMLGLAANCLMELSKRQQQRELTTSSKFRDGALEVLKFLRTCVGLIQSPRAGPVAAAYALNGDAGYAEEIAKSAIDAMTTATSQPQVFSGDIERWPVGIDEFAESSIWLQQVDQICSDRPAASPIIEPTVTSTIISL